MLTSLLALVVGCMDPQHLPWKGDPRQDQGDETDAPREDLCNGIDDDGDGHVDEDEPAVARWEDADGDGWGGAQIAACPSAAGTVGRGGDCDDGNADTYPGAQEVCGDGMFQDCDRATVCRYDHEGDITTGLTVDSPWSLPAVTGLADIDADGKNEVAFMGFQAGASGEKYPGAVYVFSGTATIGLRDEDDADASYVGLASDEMLGLEVVNLGDATGDGKPDALLVQGNSYLRPEVVTWPTGDVTQPLVAATLPALVRMYTTFNGPGDVDGDGIADVVGSDVYDPKTYDDAGCGYVFGGPLSGDLEREDARAKLLGAPDQALGYFSNAVGDLDGDGLAEVSLSSNCTADGCITTQLFAWRDPRGVSTTADADWLFTTQPSDRSIYNPHVGTDAASGRDVTGDGYDDVLLMGMGGEAGDEMAWLLEGPVADGKHDVDDLATWVVTSSDPYDLFYAGATSPGDLDGDGKNDLAVGIPEGCRDDGTCPGVVAIWYTPGQGRTDWRDADGLVWGVGYNAGGIGDIDAAGDFDGDGLADIVLGGGFAGGPGMGYVLLGAAP